MIEFIISVADTFISGKKTPFCGKLSSVICGQPFEDDVTKYLCLSLSRFLYSKLFLIDPRHTFAVKNPFSHSY